jgi:hypothetical protein
MLLGGEQMTVKALSAEKIDKLEEAVGTFNRENRNIATSERTETASLIEDAYYRESPACMEPSSKLLTLDKRDSVGIQC